jgi:hypothetical protein
VQEGTVAPYRHTPANQTRCTAKERLTDLVLVDSTALCNRGNFTEILVKWFPGAVHLRAAPTGEQTEGHHKNKRQFLMGSAL